MPATRTVLAVALLAAMAGAMTSLYVEPRIAYRLAGTALGQRALSWLLAARAPEVPAGLHVAERGDIIPTMRLQSLAGGATPFPDAFAGKPTLVNVWASWCGPCLKEMPDLQAYAAQQGAKGTQVVGISLDDAASAHALLTRLRITYPNLVDTPGPADAGVRLGNPAGVLPYSVLLSADGRLLKTRIGPFADLDAIHAWAGP